MKSCTRCGSEKPLAEFYTNGKNGLHTRCKECCRQEAKARRLDDPRVIERERSLSEDAREKRRAACRAYYDKNKDRRKEQERQRYARDSGRIKAAVSAYRRENLPKVMALNGKRRSAQKRATPAWADMDVIASLYALASIYRGATGDDFHVDHIVPLNGRTVCGLHVESSLAVIPAAENLRKGARLL